MDWENVIVSLPWATLLVDELILPDPTRIWVLSLREDSDNDYTSLGMYGRLTVVDC